MALTKIIPRMHAALPLARMRNPALEALYLRLFFAYKRHIEDPFAALVRQAPELFRGGHILDIGANVGYTATVFAGALDGEHRVFAFEPEPLNASRLRRVVARRGLGARVEIMEQAVGDEEGFAKLIVDPHHPGDHHLASGGGGGTIEVPLTTIDRFVASRSIRPVAFVKIDVQGFELPVSRGMSELIETTARLAVGFECSSDTARFGYDAAELLDFYRDRGFRLHLLTHRADRIACTSANLAGIWQRRGYADVLASR